MDHITSEIEELIIQFVIKRNLSNYIDTPSEIENVLNLDAVDDIKDRLWNLIKYELDYNSMFDEIEKHKSVDDEDEDQNSCTSREEDNSDEE